MEYKDMTPEQIHQAFHMMQRIGGGFAQKLAAAWFHADLGNQHRINEAFQDLIVDYYGAYLYTIAR